LSLTTLSGIRRQLERLGRALAMPVVGSVVGVDTSDPVVAFTFDDGPDETCTPTIVDVLGEAGAHATFFALADAARRSPALVERVLAEGHEIGLHSLSHRAMTDLSPWSRASALTRGRRELASAGRARPEWFRAPYGKQTVGTALFARALGMRPVMWSAYAREWEEHPIGWCVEHAAASMGPGSIVLLHDGAAGGRGRTRPVEEVIELVTSLLRIARERGLEVVSVGELMEHGGPLRRLWFRHWRV
jgi:peptidoglycan/xylan/chitin deacetylase (PgdA/CDA1 family)